VNEQELFQLIKSEYLPDLIKSEEQFASFDCSSKESNLYIELKCRYTHYDDLLIEKSKYARLMGEARSKSMIPMYINSTPEGVWAFNLNEVDIIWEFRDDLPMTTEFENNERVTKVVGYLPIRKGRQLC
jgi:hypothetical protein